MIADVTFYKLKGSLIMNEFPLRPSGGYFPTSSVVHTVEKCRCTKNLEQTIVVPYWDDYLDVNIAKIGDDYYWITEARETIRSSQQSVEYDLVFNAPTTLLKKGDSVNGEWMRTPTKETEYLNEPVMDSELVPMDSVRLPNISDTCHADYPIVWVEVTASASRLGTQQPVQDKLAKYGMFCVYNVTNPYNAPEINSASTGTVDTYPTLMGVITDPEIYLGLTASTIMNISVSERCPFDFFYQLDPDGHFAYRAMLQHLVSGVAQPLEPNVRIKDSRFVQDVYHSFYNLTPYDLSDAPISTEWNETEFSIPIEQLDCGTVSLYSTDNQMMMTIPNRFFTPDPLTGTAKLTIESRAVSDFTGITTHVRFPGFDKKVVVLNEGKLPWIGSAWEEYKAYEQAFDRQAVQNANQMAVLGAASSLVTAIEPSALVGAVGGKGLSGNAKVSYAGSVAGSFISAGLSIMANNMEQELKEKRVAAQPGTGYQTGYGVSYCFDAAVLGARIVLETPYAYTSTIYDNYHDEHGYRAEGVFALTLTEGFVQGELNDTSSTFKDDRLNTAFMTGFKYV